LRNRLPCYTKNILSLVTPVFKWHDYVCPPFSLPPPPAQNLRYRAVVSNGGAAPIPPPWQDYKRYFLMKLNAGEEKAELFPRST
jgi:hypothetical protein